MMTKRGDVRICKRGHVMDEANTYMIVRTGQVMCRACRVFRNAQRRKAEQFRQAVSGAL